MRKLVAALMAVAVASCAATSDPRVTKERLSDSIFDQSSLSTVQFAAKPSSCATAHLSATWYQTEDITVCWGADGVENYHDVQATNAFTLLMAAPAAIAPILALKLWN